MKKTSRHVDTRNKRQKMVDKLFGRNMPLAILNRKLNCHLQHINVGASSAS